MTALRRVLLGLGVFLVTCLPPPCAWAGGKVGDFNFNETTGLINIPVARVAPAGSVQVSLQFQDAFLGPSIRLATTPGAVDTDDFFFRNDGSAVFFGVPAETWSSR